MHIACAILGTLLVFLTLLETFEVLVLPRRVTRPFRFTRGYYRLSWRIWRSLTRLLPKGHRKQSFLSIYGPLSLLGLFAVWGAILIVGFGFLHYSFAREGFSLSDALYLSGTTFTTLGYGDLTPGTQTARALSVIEAATGFGFFAVVIGYLPVLYQAFGRREAFIALFDSRAGSPPAAARIFLRTPPVGESGACLNGFLSEAEHWCAEVLEAHLSFPVLGYYRSQHDNQSWLAALTCILDATALLLTVIETSSRTQARLTFAMARHTVVDLGLVLHRQPKTQIEDRLPPARLDELILAFRAAGVAVRDTVEARAKLLEARKLYEPFVAALASFFKLTVTEFWPTEEGLDNWRTSAWMRHAGPLVSLGLDPRDNHFD